MTDYEKLVEILGRWESSEQTFVTRGAEIQNGSGVCVFIRQGDQTVVIFFDAEGKAMP